jgi:hypothetical protein
MEGRLASPGLRKLYCRRQPCAEGAFARIKNHLGFKRFTMWGKRAATAEWCWCVWRIIAAYWPQQKLKRNRRNKLFLKPANPHRESFAGSSAMPTGLFLLYSRRCVCGPLTPQADSLSPTVPILSARMDAARILRALYARIQKLLPEEMIIVGDYWPARSFPGVRSTWRASHRSSSAPALAPNRRCLFHYISPGGFSATDIAAPMAR